jgi:hypothetical protein
MRGGSGRTPQFIGLYGLSASRLTVLFIFSRLREQGSGSEQDSASLKLGDSAPH